MPFAKGQSGNPSGRPKIVMSDGRSLKDVARGHTEDALNTLVKALADDSVTARIAAAKEILDRGWGRPSQLLGSDPENPLPAPEADPVVVAEHFAAAFNVSIQDALKAMAMAPVEKRGE